VNWKKIRVIHMPVEIHPRLRDPKYRFIKVGHKSKTPLEKGWNEPDGNTRYPFDDPSLLEYIAAGGNYGVLPGFGNLIIFDVDEVERLRELGIVQFFEGKTFTVTKRDTGKLHFYFECEGLERKIVFLDPVNTIPSKIGKGNPQPLHLGECYCSGAFQVVGPNSIHPSGAMYEVILDVPFMKITKDEFMSVFSKLVMKQQDFKDTGMIPRSTSMTRQGGTLSDVLGLKVDQILTPDNIMRVSNGVYQGSHPIHGSTYGSNFIVDTKKNVFFCFRCGKGGGPLELYAMKKGIIDCHQVRRGCLTGKWPQIFHELEQDGYKIPLLDFRETLRKNPEYQKKKEREQARKKIYSKY